MYLGSYEFDGDPVVLSAAYDRFVGGFPSGTFTLHVCTRRPGGITVIDACPSEDAFRPFSSSPELHGAFTAAGLPRPTVEPLGEVHASYVAADVGR